MTLVELLVAVVIFALAAGAVLGGLTTLSSGSGLNRLQANVGTAIRNAAEAIKAAPYVACDSKSPNPVFFSGGSFVAYQGGLAGVAVPADPANNPPALPTVTAVTDQSGHSLAGCTSGSDPGLQVVTVRDATTDGSVISTLTVTKSATSHTAVPPAMPTLTSTPSAASVLVNQSVTDSLTVTGTSKTPTGSVQFSICGPDGTPTPCSLSATNVHAVGSSVVFGSGSSASTTSPSFTPDAVGSWCFLAIYGGDANYSAAVDATAPGECVTVAAPPSSFPLLVLGTGASTLTLQGSGTLAVTGPVMIDSTTDKAVNVATGPLSASGGYFTADPSGNATCSGTCPSPWNPIAAVSDPESTLQAPSPAPPAGKCTKTGSTYSCTPGSYSTDPKPGGAGITTTFQGGVYVFNNGLTLGAGTTVQGSGVFFYLTAGKASLTPSTMTLSPPTSGAYSGILFAQAKTDTNIAVMGGNTAASTLSGLVYVPAAKVQFNNNNNKALTVKSLIASLVLVSDKTLVQVSG